MSKINDLFSISNIDKIIERNPDAPKFTLADVILILLYSDKNNALVGKTKQMKEIFLTLIELQTLKAEKIKFDFHRFGPHSEDVEDTIDNMLFSNYISAVGSKNENNFGIKITNKGAKYIGKAFEELPDTTKQLLSNKREDWDTLTSTGVINYVYTHYPEYLVKSVFKKRYAPINWDNDLEKDP